MYSSPPSLTTIIQKQWPTLSAVHILGRDDSQTVTVTDTRLASDTTSPKLSLDFSHFDHRVTSEEVVDLITEVIGAWWAEHGLLPVVSETQS